jgi:hypothetical protein
MWPRERFLSEWRAAVDETSILAPWQLTLSPQEALTQLRADV